MERIFNFLISYYDYILILISCFLTIISFILKYKSNKQNKKILRIFQILPIIINESEALFKDVVKSGEFKFNYVIEKLKVLCSELDLSFDLDFWSKKIEEFLSTPQKK